MNKKSFKCTQNNSNEFFKNSNKHENSSFKKLKRKFFNLNI